MKTIGILIILLTVAACVVSAELGYRWSARWLAAAAPQASAEPPVVFGRVPPPREGGGLAILGAKEPGDGGAGWSRFFAPSGDVVLTWANGKQETFTGGGAKPCIVGCVDLYAGAMRAAIVERRNAPDGGARAEPDSKGEAWLAGARDCIHACDPAKAMVWPPPAVDGGAR